MTISVVDLFSIGIGPSSSHTVGPMRAASRFMRGLLDDGPLPDDPGSSTPALVDVELRGSLAATGRGHGSDRAIVLGLAGHEPATVSPDVEPVPGADVAPEGVAEGPWGRVPYRISFNAEEIDGHPNGMIFTAHGHGGAIRTQTWFSVGGGFVVSGEEMAALRDRDGKIGAGVTTTGRDGAVPHPFTTGDELLAQCRDHGLDIADVMAANELAIHRGDGTVDKHLDAVWRTMRECMDAGVAADGVLPGGLRVRRRARDLNAQLTDARADDGEGTHADALSVMEWVNVWALAVNEENAAGGRVVTAPTNGAAGIIPAVMRYGLDHVVGFTPAAARRFLLAAGAIGIVVKENASISGAEVGCQGEVGSAAAMAAAGLCEVMGGDPKQVENAAEIALEHNLGLTCDPVGGLVQIPCIERNAVAAVQAINAARLARLGDGDHAVSLDEAVRTMAATGRDMMTKYKETSTGGLAVELAMPVNRTEC
ncbi:L-serine ammonia-lyase [uncultured Corynebacterium sp.]|uniref:L-serine ammonia-lyase n=1 Tax=uncultured Corynebacterium sp. TaxID=159447 RepID=UPI0025F78042|nr:L-serine ammonia-lyase [uncultured Corynebacterium sp.]